MRFRMDHRSGVFPLMLGFWLVLAGSVEGKAQDWQKLLMPEDAQRPRLVMPLIDIDRGRRLFVVKGCVLCHAINGVGGTAGPALDAEDNVLVLNPLDFAARMWRGADAMLQLQATELGDFIALTGDEIADLSGFIADRESQASFSLEEVPEMVRDWMVHERYWETEEWPEDYGDEPTK